MEEKETVILYCYCILKTYIILLLLRLSNIHREDSNAEKTTNRKCYVQFRAQKTRWNSTGYTRLYSRLRRELKVSWLVNEYSGLNSHTSQVLYNLATSPSLGFLRWSCLCLLSVCGGAYLHTQQFRALELAMA